MTRTFTSCCGSSVAFVRGATSCRTRKFCVRACEEINRIKVLPKAKRQLEVRSLNVNQSHLSVEIRILSRFARIE